MFFFQAEDGIRDIGVTGVQTCALPISHSSFTSERRVRLVDRLDDHQNIHLRPRLQQKLPKLPKPGPISAHGWSRSEERRVGKECRPPERQKYARTKKSENKKHER